MVRKKFYEKYSLKIISSLAACSILYSAIPVYAYDLNDNVVCYFDNFAELSKIINYPSWKLARRFEIFGNLINVTIDNKDYKLFATCDTNNSLSLKKCLK